MRRVALGGGAGFVVSDFEARLHAASRVFSGAAVTYNAGSKLTFVSGSPSKMEIGWRVMGDLFPVTVFDVLGSDYVFAGDVTANFTVTGSYTSSAPDLTAGPLTGGTWTDDPAYDGGLGVTSFPDSTAGFPDLDGRLGHHAGRAETKLPDHLRRAPGGLSVECEATPAALRPAARHTAHLHPGR
ncbi:MAG: hypothetical protein IPP14_16200 [Planctomycetes bacterium]|nr:hypothetical protein [Planctomycetota bacterium]